MTKLSELTELLLEKTAAGKIRWSVDYDARVHAMLGTNIVEIISIDDIDPAMLMITLRDVRGVIILREEFREGTETFERLKKILSSATGASSGVNEALSDLRSHLEAL